MQVLDYKVFITPDEEDRGYVVRCPSFQGCYSQGDTVEEALANIKEVIEMCLEELQEEGKPLPDDARVLIGSVAVTV